MNTDTGRIYETAESIAAAEQRGEPLAMVSRTVVNLVRAGKRAERKRKRKMARQSRKANRT